MLTEASTQLVRTTLQVGELDSKTRFFASITPAALDIETGRSIATSCTIEVPTVSADLLCITLRRAGFVIKAAALAAKTTSIHVDFGYDMLVEAVEKLANMDWRDEPADPRYWFSFGDNQALRAGMYVVSIRRSPRVLKIYQNLDRTNGEPQLASFPVKFWDDFRGTLGLTQLYDDKVWVVHPRDGSPRHLQITLSSEAAINFENTLHRIMRFVPRD